jgi:ubiquinone/menaquinone biosynthesis C-methylase UbiE
MSPQSSAIDKNDPQKAREFNDISMNIFAPVYPRLAEMALEKCQIQKGLCLEIGCGPALFSIALAKLTDLEFIALDHSPPMLIHAEENIKANRLSGRIQTMEGDVHSLPLDSGSVDIVISRGSVLFWENKTKAFSEIKRVLKKEGKSFIGCGMGSKSLKEKVFEAMRKIDADWDKSHRDRNTEQAPHILEQAAEAAGFPQYKATQDDAGIWIFLNNG